MNRLLNPSIIINMNRRFISIWHHRNRRFINIHKPGAGLNWIEQVFASQIGLPFPIRPPRVFVFMLPSFVDRLKSRNCSLSYPQDHGNLRGPLKPGGLPLTSHDTKWFLPQRLKRKQNLVERLCQKFDAFGTHDVAEKHINKWHICLCLK